jgi:hypothetical protein
MPTEDEKRFDEGQLASAGGEAGQDDRVEPIHGRNGERAERTERAATLNERSTERIDRAREKADRADRTGDRSEKAEKGDRDGDRDKAERDERGLRDRLEGLVPDIVRKTFYAGLGALFTTEEGIRKLTNDFSLPKDVANYLLSSADGAKDEVLRILGRELHEFFARVNLSSELAKLLTQLSFEIKTEIRFIPNDEAVGGLAIKPDIKRKVALKRTKDSTEPDEPGAD